VAGGIAISVPWEAETLDPHQRDRVGEFTIASHFYEALVELDPDLGIRPRLATRWVNPDALTWVFYLRPAVRFHDGRELTAADVVYSFQRVMNDEHLYVGSYTIQIEAVRALDASTFEIRTKKPLSVLLNKIASVVIIPKGISKTELERRPNGTGRYRFTAWTPGERVEMMRNEAHWDGGKCLDRVTFLLKRSSADAVSDLKNGRSQFVQGSGRAVDDALRDNPELIQARQTGLHLKYLGFDFTQVDNPHVSKKPNPFLNRLVREAVSLAIDRKRLVRELSTLARPASQLVPPAVFGFNASLPELAHDPERARELMKEAGLASGFEVTLHTRAILDEPARILAGMLSGIGIRTTVRSMADPEFFNLVKQPGSAFFLNRFGCSSGDASDVLDAAIHSIDRRAHFGDTNIGGYSNPSLDLTIEESAAILQASSRAQALKETMASVMSEMVLVPLYFDEDVYAFHKGFTWRPRADSAILAWEIGTK
jgi:peptide/nickel transport system substrate-binding protein